VKDQAAESEVERWHRLYSHLLEIERHWTAQIQNQQQRISTILSVNGFLLGFLASVGFSNALTSRGSWPRYLFLASLIALSLALMMGILSLGPRIPISGAAAGAAWEVMWKSFKPAKEHSLEPLDHWLDSAAVFRATEKVLVPEEEALRKLATSLVKSQVKADHPGVLQARRLLMYRQLTLLLLGLVLLVAALIAFQVSVR
jgi:hypothetical protein